MVWKKTIRVAKKNQDWPLIFQIEDKILLHNYSGIEVLRYLGHNFGDIINDGVSGFVSIFSSSSFFLQLPMTCRNLCERLYSKIIVGESHYRTGKKYCRRCEVYFLRDGLFCLCCGMRLGVSPVNERDRNKTRGFTC